MEQPAPPHPPRDGSATLLDSGELEVLGRIPWASNATLLAKVRGGDQEALAIYKPARGERPLWDFPAGTLYRREVAAYLVSELLGWGLVPRTVARGGPFGVGSVQGFVEADPDVTAFELIDAGHEVLPLLAAFDVVINNADRKAGHCLVDAGGKVWAIDHGVSFHTEPKLRTVLWSLAGQPLGRRLVTDLRRLARQARAGDDLAALLGPLELAALAERAEELAGTGCLPAPEGRWSYPWPLV